MRPVILLVIACALPALEATKCYQCKENGPAIGDCQDIEKVKLAECPSETPTCSTATIILNGQNITVSYGCYPKNDDECMELPKGESICFCNQDGCNSPPKGNLDKNDSKMLYSSISVVTISALFLQFVRNCY